MNRPAISIQGLWKAYTLGRQHETLWNSLTHTLRHPWNSLRERWFGKEPFWALKEINLQVERGEVLGLIGANGAGKSTLLKILGQIVKPSKGQVEFIGRLSALLEVGTGFHPDLSGRENVFLNGAILGMRRREIIARFDEIVEFSGIGKFIDTPVKRYSTGMRLRLAFSVSAHLNPDILLVDEVLAVGDAEFQNKCLGKMGAVAREGRTVLLVSHNLGAIEALCQRAICLQKGEIVLDGPAGQVIESYLASTSKQEQQATGPLLETGSVRVAKMVVQQNGADNPAYLNTDLPFLVEIHFETSEPQDLLVGFDLLTPEGVLIYRTMDIPKEKSLRQPGYHCATWHVPAGTFNPHQYILDLLVHIRPGNWLCRNQIRLPLSFSENFSPKLLRNGLLKPDGHWTSIHHPDGSKSP
jgi:lipopolysaccharide transport system ATP-binding protein